MKQSEINTMFEKWRPSPKYPTYPPYHTGLYLEDYFFDRYGESEFTDRKYIPVFWTTCHIDSCPDGLQDALNKLPEGNYFTICQHDDGTKHKLPKYTIEFNCSHLNENTVPIPLVASLIPERYLEPRETQYLASFVGSATHPIRDKMVRNLKNIFSYITYKQWSNSPSEEEFIHFAEVTKSSVFCLCPRGYGLNSFRISEAIQFGKVPVIVTDTDFFPFKDILERCSVIIKEDRLPYIDKILLEEFDNVEEKIAILNDVKHIFCDIDNICSMLYEAVNK